MMSQLVPVVRAKKLPLLISRRHNFPKYVRGPYRGQNPDRFQNRCFPCAVLAYDQVHTSKPLNSEVGKLPEINNIQTVDDQFLVTTSVW